MLRVHERAKAKQQFGDLSCYNWLFSLLVQQVKSRITGISSYGSTPGWRCPMASWLFFLSCPI